MGDENLNRPAPLTRPLPVGNTPLITAQVDNLVKSAQNIFASVLGLASFLTAGGFIVVNTHLAKYTGIQGYNVDPKQYLAAGVGLLIPITIASMLVGALYLVGQSYGSRLDRIRAQDIARPGGIKVEQVIARRIRNEGSSFQKRLRRLRYWILLIGVIYYTIFFGLIYGQYIYGSIPRFLGGGRPEPMMIIFNDAQLPTLLNLSADPVQTRRTGTVLLLAELVDGVLILDTNTGQVASVKNETVTGMAAASTLEWAVAPSPTLPPAPTP